MLVISKIPLDMDRAAREAARGARRECAHVHTERRLVLVSIKDPQKFPVEARTKFQTERPYLAKNKRYKRFS